MQFVTFLLNAANVGVVFAVRASLHVGLFARLSTNQAFKVSFFGLRRGQNGSTFSGLCWSRGLRRLFFRILDLNDVDFLLGLGNN